MAIQVGGTTVIDDSRNLTNVGGLKTVGGTSVLGSGDISVGGSTDFNAVGTYCWAGKWATTTKVNPGGTLAGSSLYSAGVGGYVANGSNYIYGYADNSTTALGMRVYSTLSGTWRAMGYYNPYNNSNSSYGAYTLWCRIS